MNAQLKRERLRNFRCYTDATFEFSHDTLVRGTNGTGKSTLFDGFCFCLFGKDSNGRTDFGYKRRDADGNIVHELEYAVELTFDIDGVERIFERVVVEKWTKPRGAKEKVLTGNECAYYVDRVRCATKKEYDNAVAQITSEEVMRIMTDVYYFISLKDDVKKATLLKLAYGTSDTNEADAIVVKEVLEAYPDFNAFIDKLNGVSLRDFNKTIVSKINAIKSEIDEIPAKIAAKKEAIPPAEDWDALQTLIDANNAELAEIDKQIADVNARQAGATEAINKLRSAVSNKEYELLQAENAVRTNVTNSELSVRQQLAQIEAEIVQLNTIRSKDASTLESDRKIFASLEQRLVALREQYKAIKNGTFQYTDDELRCPTCGHPYDKDKLVEQKLNENKSNGVALKNGDYTRYSEEITILEERIKKADNRLVELNNIKAQINFHPADVAKLIATDTKCQSIRAEIDTLKAQITASPSTLDTSSLTTTKREIEAKIQGFLRQLGGKEIIARVEAQIAELEKKQAALNAELGELETMQDTAKEFQKAKDNQLLDKVNRLFTIVTWNFVSEQYNGNDKIACNCFVEGMPYAERNRAGQVNAGLDIINAIARAEGVHLPIFIDNAESVVEYIPTESQKILLRVDGSCKELVFE